MPSKKARAKAKVKAGGDDEACQHTIQAVFDPGDEVGWMYTVGLHKQGKPELYAADVPRWMIDSAAGALNYFAECGLPGEAFQSSGLGLTTKELASPGKLLADKMCHCDPRARVIQLTPGVRIDMTWEVSMARTAVEPAASVCSSPA